MDYTELVITTIDPSKIRSLDEMLIILEENLLKLRDLARRINLKSSDDRKYYQRNLDAIRLLYQRAEELAKEYEN